MSTGCSGSKVTFVLVFFTSLIVLTSECGLLWDSQRRMVFKCGIPLCRLQ